MKEVIKHDIIIVLETVLDILKIKEEKDTNELKKLSDHTIHNASIFQDEYSISIAVSIYAISKIIERGSYIDNDIINLLSKAKSLLLENKTAEHRLVVKRLIEHISKIDNKLRLYIGEVIDQAQIKKGSKLYAHGISMARAAEILGVSQWELMAYVGKTRITDTTSDMVDVRTRLKTARSIFGI